MAVSNGARWSSGTSIKPGRLPVEDTEVVTNETIIPMGMFDDYSATNDEGTTNKTIIPMGMFEDSPSAKETAETIVPEMNSLPAQTIIPMDNTATGTIVPHSTDQDQTIIPPSEETQIDQNVALITDEGTYMEDNYFIGNSKVTIGRAQENHLVIYNDPTVSRTHCEICYRNSNFYITDNSSFHGTYLNGERIHQSILNNNDQIKLGNTVIRFRFL